MRPSLSYSYQHFVSQWRNKQSDLLESKSDLGWPSCLHAESHTCVGWSESVRWSLRLIFISLTTFDAIKFILAINPFSTKIQTFIHSVKHWNQKPEIQLVVRSHVIIIIVVIQPLPPLVTLSSVTSSLRQLTGWILTQHIEFPDLMECSSEFLDAESVNNGINSWIGMREEDGDVKDVHLGPFTVGAKEVDAVEDV